MSRVSGMPMAMGFSQNVAMRASRHFLMSEACVPVGVTMTAVSTPFSASSTLAAARAFRGPAQAVHALHFAEDLGVERAETTDTEDGDTHPAHSAMERGCPSESRRDPHPRRAVRLGRHAVLATGCGSGHRDCRPGARRTNPPRKGARALGRAV